MELRIIAKTTANHNHLLITTFLCIFFISISCAKENANWIIGVGLGYGNTKIDTIYSESTRNQLGIATGGTLNTWTSYNPGINSSSQSWGLAYEILLGFKHFLNDYIGFRYYANIGAMNYKDAIFSGNKEKVGVIEYSANADLLINFYNGNAFSFGIFGGFGVGGATFDSDMLDRYEYDWGSAKDSVQYNEAMYSGIGKIYKHHFSASASVGARVNFFQSLRGAGQLICSAGSDGRRSCRQGLSTLEHSLEVVAKISLTTYNATKDSDTISTYVTQTGNNGTGTYLRGISNRPAYEIKTPYKFLLRYIMAF